MLKLDLSKLENVKRNSDESIQCRCPACSADGRDSTGNHLRIFKNGAFNCVIDSSHEHNKAIYKYLVNHSDNNDIGYEFINEKQKIIVEQIFPEESLNKLVKDHSYWSGRGIPEKNITIFNGGISPQDEKNKLSNRYIFPIRNKDNRLVGFAGRLLYNNSVAPKWKILGSKRNFIFPSKTISYNSLSTTKTAILVESIGCVLALSMHGTFNTLCLFGLNISSKQIMYLVSCGVQNIIIATNNEESGIGNEAAIKLKEKLKLFFNESNIHVHLPYQKDFLEMSSEEIEKWKSNIPIK